MRIVFVQVVIGLGLALAALWLALVVSFRTRFAPVQRVVRRMNRRVLNPRQLRTAGQRGAWASVVRHVGRTSGTLYRTPVVPVEVDDGFIVALPYGPGADWVQNVLAAGAAELEHQGATVAVARPELLPLSEANPHFPAKDQWTHRLYGVDDFLRLRRSKAR